MNGHRSETALGADICGEPVETRRSFKIAVICQSPDAALLAARQLGAHAQGFGYWGALTGHRFDLILVAPPVRPFSATERENFARWSCEDLPTKLSPGGSIIFLDA